MPKDRGFAAPLNKIYSYDDIKVYIESGIIIFFECCL